MDREHINWDALVNYITGQSSLEEEEVIREWMRMDPEHEEFIVFLKKIWNSSAEEKHSWDVDAAWARFNEQYGSPFSESRSSVARKINVLHRNQRTKQSWISWGAVAATVAIIFTVLFSLDVFHSEMAVEKQGPAVQEFTTKNGQRTHLNLSDGSRVILNAGSKLSVLETFRDKGPREINLSGEAWFEVAHDPERPFIIYTEDAKTKVLGTKFQVRSYPEDEQVEVVVSEGKVAVQDQARSDETGATIIQNQVGIYSGDGSITVSTVTDLSPYLGWTEGKLVFDQEPLGRVIRKLRRWYDVDIQIDSSQSELAQKTFTASFAENQPVAEVLEAIALALEIEYRKEDDRFAFLLFNNN